MGEKGFRVIVRGATGSPEDWARTLRTAPSELPSLTKEEKERARVFKWDQQDYARGKLLSQLGEQKWTQKGQQLGSRIQEVLTPLESEYRLDVVVAEVPKLRWTARFESSTKGFSDVHLDDDLVEDLLCFNAMEDAEKLKRKLLAGLGEDKYLVPR